MSLFNTNSQMRRTMAYTNKVGDKVYPVVVDIKKGIKSTEEIQFVSSDVNTGILSVAFIQGNDNYNVAGADVVCSVMRPDASTLELPCEVVRENIVEVPLGINGTSQDGVYSFDFKVFKGGNKIVGTPIMNYSVSLSIGNDMVVEEDDRLPVLTVLMTQLTELKEETREAINQANVATASSREATANAIEATNNANAVSERVSQESSEAITRVDNTIVGLNNTVSEKISEIEVAKSDMTTTVSNKVNEVETRFNALTSSQQQDAEVIDARDGETSLKARLDRDIEKTKQVYVNVEGNHISTDSSVGYLKDVEILGNTIQDASNLADIRSVGDTVEGQELYEIPIISTNNIIDVKSTTIGDEAIHYNIEPIRQSFEVMRLKGYSVSILIHKNNSWQRNVVLKTNGLTAINLNDGEYVNQILLYAQDGWDLSKQYNLTNIIHANIKLEHQQLTILSPVQLEKVRDVRDRIIEKDGVWGVEKNVGEQLFDSNSTWTQNSISENYIEFICQNIIPTNIAYGSSSSNFIVGTNHYNIRTSGSTGKVIIQYKISEVPTLDATEFTSHVANNPFIIKYVLAQPIFIPLPHDQQVKLRTFANKTNISFLTEIEGTIKAQVPKSLGATVNTHTEQIRSLNNELNRVKKLEESTVSTVTTESDFTTVEATSNGYFEDVKLEGKTLVNLWDVNKVKVSEQTVVKNNRITVITTNNVYSNFFYEQKSKFKPLTEYTIIVDIYKNTLQSNDDIFITNYSGASSLGRDIFATNGSTQFIVKGGIIGRIVKKYTTISDFSEVAHSMRSFVANNSQTEGGELELAITVLEGDHTQNPPSFFEGLKSVGQSATTSEDGVDEISVESVSENLFDCETQTEIIGDGSRFEVSVKNNTITVNNKGDLFESFAYIRTEVLPNTSYRLLYKHTGVLSNLKDFDPMFEYLDANKVRIGTSLYGDLPAQIFETPSNCKYIGVQFRFRIGTPRGIGEIKDIQLVQGDTPKPYTPHQSDKKRLLYYNEKTQTWEKPILREWDSIEKHADGKYYYHQRSGEVVLNGSEEWHYPESQNGNNTILLYSRISDAKINQHYPICDMFNGAYLNIWEPTTDIEGIFINHNKDCILRLNKSKLSTQDVQGFKQWLQANNVTVVYQLAEEKVYECTNIDLITYANETNYVVNSGAIVPKTTLKVHNNISNVVSLLQKKVSLLESNVKASQEVQDMMILETDMRMLDIELALMEFVPMKLNLGGSDMLRSATYFNFLKNHIINETYEKEYLENVMNKYLATGRINQDEYDELYKMLYPPVYDIELPIEL